MPLDERRPDHQEFEDFHMDDETEQFLRSQEGGITLNSELCDSFFLQNQRFPWTRARLVRVATLLMWKRRGLSVAKVGRLGPNIMFLHYSHVFLRCQQLST